METRAKHIAVGSFVIAFALGIAFFVFWLARYEGEVRYDQYFARFSGSVSQLRIDSTVLFGGIPVGRVTDVRIDAENSELARVDMAIRGGTPIRVDSKATLEIQGLAGGVIIQISRGTCYSALLPSESEIIAGFHSEYSGMKFGMFFVGEYVGIILISSLTVALFFGGWLGPDFLPPAVWFILKTFVFIFVFILLRASLPRPRYDQLMDFGWKILLPITIINLMVTAAIVLYMKEGWPY